jgi:glucokinase
MPNSPSSPLVVGIDLGGTNMQIGVVDADNKIIGTCRKKTKATEGPERVLERLIKGVAEACAEATIRIEDLGAVGLASAGAIDVPKGIMLNSPNLSWKDLPVRDILHDKLGCPVVLDNDVRGAVWGEYHLGAGRGEGDLMGVWVGTGVGGGLILNGGLYYGELFTAGEIGHTIIQPDGPPGRRSVEDLCSRGGMSRIILDGLKRYPASPVWDITDGTGQITGSKQLRQAIDEGCELTTMVVNRAAQLLGIAVANMVTVLSIDNVIMGGGVTEALGKPWLHGIRATFEANVFPDRAKKASIAATELGDNAGLLGASLLARAAVPQGQAAAAS